MNKKPKFKIVMETDLNNGSLYFIYKKCWIFGWVLIDKLYGYVSNGFSSLQDAQQYLNRNFLPTKKAIVWEGNV